jgi:hypothetical protein
MLGSKSYISLAYYNPEWMVENNLISKVVYYNRKWAWKRYPARVADCHPAWAIDRHPKWMARFRPEMFRKTCPNWFTRMRPDLVPEDEKTDVPDHIVAMIDVWAVNI